MHWFSLNSRCPICRYDIREYSNNDENEINNDENEINNDDSSNNENKDDETTNNTTLPSYTYLRQPNNTTRPTSLASSQSLNRLVMGAIQGLLQPSFNDISMNESVLNFQYSMFDPNNID